MHDRDHVEINLRSIFLVTTLMYEFMELISIAKTDHLLNASLESLHTDSREWLSEIDFWNEEMSFFYKLMHRREPHISFPTANLASVEKEMIQITSEDLCRLKSEVESHERSLSALVKNNSFGEEQEYRDRHKNLLRDMYNIQVRIKKFKSSVFSFVK